MLDSVGGEEKISSSILNLTLDTQHFFRLSILKMPKQKPMIKKVFFLSLVLASFYGVAQSGNAQPAPLYTLRMKFVPGTVNRYQTNAQIVTIVPLEQGMQPITNTLDVDLLQSVHVNKSLPKGGGEVSTSTQSGRITQNGKTVATPVKNEVITTTYDAQGNLVKISGLKAPSTGNGTFGGLVGSGALNLQRVYLPLKPVRIGESWTLKVSIAGLPGAGTGSAKATFVRLENVGRYQTARIHAVLTAPLKVYLTADSRTTTDPKRAAQSVTGTLRMEFDSNFAMAEGKVVRSGGSGSAVVDLTPVSATKRPAKSSKSKTGKTVPPPPMMPRVTIQLRVGNNLIE